MEYVFHAIKQNIFKSNSIQVLYERKFEINCSRGIKQCQLYKSPVRKELLKRTREREEPEYGARRCLRFKFNVNMRFNGPSKAGCAGADCTRQHSVPPVFPFLSTCTNVQINLPQYTEETSLNNHIFPTFALFTSETFHSPSANFCWELSIHVK